MELLVHGTNSSRPAILIIRQLHRRQLRRLPITARPRPTHGQLEPNPLPRLCRHGARNQHTLAIRQQRKRLPGLHARGDHDLERLHRVRLPFRGRRDGGWGEDAHVRSRARVRGTGYHELVAVHEHAELIARAHAGGDGHHVCLLAVGGGGLVGKLDAQVLAGAHAVGAAHVHAGSLHCEVHV